MTKPDLSEVLIVLPEQPESGFYTVERALTEEGGVIVAAYPPRVLLSKLDLSSLEKLRLAMPDVTIYTDVVDDRTLRSVDDTSRSILAAWNERRSSREKGGEVKGRGMAWDAPGFLPPDPPADIREMLKRREDEEP